jgi:pyruvate/2-oxoacid:ferredoxin oxidoreductase alpha subunit
LYDLRKKPNIVAFIGGLGGRDISVNEFKYMIREAQEKEKAIERGEDVEVEMIGIRE